MSESAGRVLMIPKGTYSPTTTYDPLDAVKYEQNSYVCKQTSRGNLPTNTTYWQPLTDVTADENPTEDSTNLVQSGGVYSALKTINETLTNRVKGNWSEGGKNLLPNTATTQTINGVTFTKNDDGSITANGTATANAEFRIQTLSNHGEGIKEILGKSVIYNGCPSGGSTRTYQATFWTPTTGTLADNGNGVQFDVPSDMLSNNFTIAVIVRSGYTASDLTFYPMLRLASDTDDTYEPYAKTNKQLTEDSVTWDDLIEVGAVNLAPNNLVTQTVSQANFTLTHNADDSITAYSDGVTSDWSIDVCSITIKAGTYRLKGTGTDDVKFQIVDNPIVHQLYAAGANDVIMTFATDTAIKLRVSVFNGKSYDNIVIYPMITPVSYNGPYVPPAKTNKELTDELSTKIDIAGKPKQKVHRFAGGSTTTTITVPLDKLSSYAQGSLHIRTSSKDSEAHITFALNQGNTSVVASEIKNYGTVTLSLDSITISGQVLSIVIGGGTAYEWYSAEYFASLSEGVTGKQPDWNFS